MPTQEERLALVLEASDKATAILQKVRKEIEETTDANKKGAKGGKENADNLNSLSNTTPRLKEMGKQMSGVAFAINEARLGSKGAVMEIASLASNAAESSVAFAAWAPAIAGSVALLGTALAIVQDTRREEQQLANFQAHLQGQTLENLRKIADQTAQQRDRSLKLIEANDLSMLERAVGYVDLLSGHYTSQALRTAAERGSFANVKTAGSENEAATKDLLAAERIERNRLQTLSDQSRVLVEQRELGVATGESRLRLVKNETSALEAQTAELRSQFAIQAQSVRLMFFHRDEAGKVVPLTKQEVAERGRLLGLNAQLLSLARQEATVRERLRTVDATFDITSRIRAVQIQSQMEAGAATARDHDRLAAYTAYQRESVAIQRAGYSAEFRAAQEARLLLLYQGQITLLDQIADRVERSAHADRLSNSSNPLEAIKGRMEQIQLEEEAQRAAGVSEIEIAKTVAQKKRELIRQTMGTTADSLKSIEDLTLNSDNNRTKAAHNFAKNYRALIIGAKAAEAAVDSAVAFASIPKHLAVQDYSGAFLAGLAGTQLAAAAAIGFAEAGGGGTSSSGAGGGGGSDVGGRSTFQPNGPTDGAQPLVVNIYTQHPSDPKLVQSIAYELRKGELLKRPDLQSPPPVAIGASSRAA